MARFSRPGRRPLAMTRSLGGAAPGTLGHRSPSGGAPRASEPSRSAAQTSGRSNRTRPGAPRQGVSSTPSPGPRRTPSARTDLIRHTSCTRSTRITAPPSVFRPPVALAGERVPILRVLHHARARRTGHYGARGRPPRPSPAPLRDASPCATAPHAAGLVPGTVALPYEEVVGVSDG